MGASYSRRSATSPEKSGAAFSGVQGDFFRHLDEPSVIARPNAPALDIGPELMGAINTAIREARKNTYGRDRVVDRINACLAGSERAITKRQLDSWTAASKEHHPFPLDVLAAFCWATGCDEPLRVLARALGFDLVDAREQAAKKLGEMQIELARLKRQSGALTKRLGNS